MNIHPSFSLVLPVYQRASLMFPVLRSIALARTPPMEVIMVNDGKRDDDLLLLAGLFTTAQPRSTWKVINTGHEEKTYRNSSYPYNVGIKAAQGDVIIYCAGELIHLPDNFYILRSNYDSDKFLIGGTILFEAEKTNFSSEQRNDPQDIIDSGNYDFWHEDYYGNEFAHMMMKDTRSGVHAVSRSALIDVGGFEESLTALGHNDGQMRRRMVNLLGLEQVMLPNVIIIHQWHPRPPQDNMSHSTSDRQIAESAPPVANRGKEWGIVHESY